MAYKAFHLAYSPPPYLRKHVKVARVFALSLAFIKTGDGRLVMGSDEDTGA